MSVGNICCYCCNSIYLIAGYRHRACLVVVLMMQEAAKIEMQMDLTYVRRALHLILIIVRLP